MGTHTADESLGRSETTYTGMRAELPPSDSTLTELAYSEPWTHAGHCAGATRV